MKYFLVGIKGSGMRALAQILVEMGNVVKGVDYKNDDISLEGIEVFDFANYCADETFFYVIGNSFVNHPLVQTILKLNYPCDYYPHFINQLFLMNKICVAGTHGKTTTTKMIADLSHDFSYLVGDGSGHYSKNNPFFVMEACEYQNHFLEYNSFISVILNVDYDHVDFFKTRDEYCKAFENFSSNAHILVYNADDSYLEKIKHKNRYGFGLNNPCFLRGRLEKKRRGYLLILNYEGNRKEVLLPWKCTHMIYNFMASFLTLYLLNYNMDEVLKKVRSFQLPKRRLQNISIKSNQYYLDYAHHPNEINAVYDYLSNTYEKKRKIAIFQSHTNTRSMHFIQEFKEALAKFDEVYLLPIFTSNREEKNENEECTFEKELGYPLFQEDCIEAFKKYKKAVFVFMGAGDIDKVYNAVLSKIKNEKAFSKRS